MICKLTTCTIVTSKDKLTNTYKAYNIEGQIVNTKTYHHYMSANINDSAATYSRNYYFKIKLILNKTQQYYRNIPSIAARG